MNWELIGYISYRLKELMLHPYDILRVELIVKDTMTDEFNMSVITFKNPYIPITLGYR